MRRTHLRLACVLLLAGLANGCLSVVTREWARDEVTLVGQNRSDLTLSLKNVEGFDEGMYAVLVREDWRLAPRRIGADGLTELLDPGDGLQPGLVDSHGAKRGVAVELDAGRAREPPPPRSPHERGNPWVLNEYPVRFGYEILCREDRRYELTVYAEDADRGEWVRLGTVSVGRGMQSGMRRPLYYVAAPVCFVADIALLPVEFIGLLAMLAFGQSD
jgi:hypothetical protein